MLRLAARPLVPLLVWGWLSGVTTAGQASLAQNSASMTDADVNAIRTERERSNRALVAHDVATFADSLASDFVMVRGNGGFVPRLCWQASAAQ